jgi:hypothetical protein
MHNHQTVRLSRGAHRNPHDGVCVMELASLLAGESFTDKPRTASPVIAAFLRAYNDGVDDERRQDLYGYASRVVGTRGGGAEERARAKLCRRFLAEDGGRVPLRVRLAPGAATAAWAGKVCAGTRDGHGAALSLIEGMLAIGAAREPLERELAGLAYERAGDAARPVTNA